MCAKYCKTFNVLHKSKEGSKVQAQKTKAATAAAAAATATEAATAAMLSKTKATITPTPNDVFINTRTHTHTDEQQHSVLSTRHSAISTGNALLIKGELAAAAVVEQRKRKYVHTFLQRNS